MPTNLQTFKSTSLHSTIHSKNDMLVRLCSKNYATSSGLVNGIDGMFKMSMTL